MIHLVSFWVGVKTGPANFPKKAKEVSRFWIVRSGASWLSKLVLSLLFPVLALHAGDTHTEEVGHQLELAADHFLPLAPTTNAAGKIEFNRFFVNDEPRKFRLREALMNHFWFSPS